MQMKPNPVWRIEPGWIFVQGILTRVDSEFRQEARLAHEVFSVLRVIDAQGRKGPPRGGHVGRECDLPVVVRCSSCHSLRYVLPSVVLQARNGRDGAPRQLSVAPSTRGF